MGLDLVYESGGGVRVGAKVVEDDVNFAPQVAVGALFKRVALAGGVGLISFNDIAGVNPEDPHEVTRTELEEGEETEGFGSGHRLAPWDFPLDSGDGGWD